MVRPLSVRLVVAMIIGGLVRPPAGWAEPLVPHLVLTASGGPSIAVLAVGLDPRAQGQLGALEAAAEGALTRAGRFTVVPVQDVANPAAGRGRKEKLAEARAKVREGRRALDELDNVKATDALIEALAALRRTDLSRTFSELIDGWMLKAAAHATGGESGPAKKDIEAVLALSPATELSPAFFSADLVKYGEAQRKPVTRGELTVRTEPPGAQVWLDGVYRGGSPVTVGGLPSTRHLVSVALGGSQLAQAELAPGVETLKLEPAELGPQWKRAQLAVASDPEGPGRDRAVVELGRQLGVEQLLLVVAKKSTTGDRLELVGARLEIRDGHNAAWRTGTFADAGWAAFFDELATSDTPRIDGAPVKHQQASAGASSRLVPSLALAGGGAVALVVGGIFGVLALGQADQFHQTPQTKVVVSQQLKRDGQTYALVADISFLVGIAAAATGGVVWFTAPKGTEAPEPAAQRESARPIDSPTAGPAAPQPAPVKGETAKAEPEERKSKKRSKRQQRDDEEAERRRRDEEAKADEARNRRDAEQREAERKAEERRAADRANQARRREGAPRAERPEKEGRRRPRRPS